MVTAHIFMLKREIALWQKEKQFFIVSPAVMNHQNGWGSARDAENGIHLSRNR